LPIESHEIKHCHKARLWYFAAPFSPVNTPVKRGNGLEFRVRVDADGHNNTKLNPVFRGMVCRKTGFQPKENCAEHWR
jgi:hypothetical protein